MKENVRDAHRVSLREALVAEAERMRLVSRTEDHRNLVRAWLAAAKEKRGENR
jgi:2-(1,2-epoxy-1,2-dihydrophenyl)acetyl-CoA isomerase